jgi:putative oxidoreductase
MTSAETSSAPTRPSRRILAYGVPAARLYLGALFVIASWHKIMVPRDFAVDIATYDLLPLSLVNLAAITLPWLELACGALLLLGLCVRAAALLVAAMLLVFMGAVAAALTRGLHLSCGCFASHAAQAEDPISYLTLLRDGAWLALAGAVVWLRPDGFGIRALLRRRGSDA